MLRVRLFRKDADGVYQYRNTAFVTNEGMMKVGRTLIDAHDVTDDDIVYVGEAFLLLARVAPDDPQTRRWLPVLPSDPRVQGLVERAETAEDAAIGDAWRDRR